MATVSTQHNALSLMLKIVTALIDGRKASIIAAVYNYWSIKFKCTMLCKATFEVYRQSNTILNYRAHYFSYLLNATLFALIQIKNMKSLFNDFLLIRMMNLYLMLLDVNIRDSGCSCQSYCLKQVFIWVIISNACKKWRISNKV